jgi:hypothetical protein
VAFGALLDGAAFLLALPRLLRAPITPDGARDVLAQRLRDRERHLLHAVRGVTGPGATGPYARLLEAAGAEYGDVERLVRAGGVEGALRALARSGVYLTVDEFKGRRPVERNGASFRVDPAELRQAGASGRIPARTSGSRGRPTPVPIGLAAIRDWAVDACLDYEARDGLGWVQGRWTVPGADSIVFLLMFCAFGAVPVRWFCPIDAGTARLHARYGWSARTVRWVARLAGTPFPAPEHAPLEEPRAVAQWLASVRRGGRVPHLVTYVSSAVRVCETAVRLGLDIAGARFTVTGEPITAARLDAIRRAGAEAAPSYGSVDAGLIGAGCLAPVAPDEVHLHHDLVTVIQPDRPDASARLRPDALLVSAFRPAAPLLLLNVSLGDAGRLGTRRCGCPLERVGWTGHLHAVRSFEKLTAGGMTLLDTDVVRVLEEVLPARFGGGPTDYQLVEDEASGGAPRLRLLVDPRVGGVSLSAVGETFLAGIGHGRGAERVTALHWRDAGLLRVERRRPLAARSGKVLHLHRLPARAAPGDGVG